jgi:uncharacterized protein (TIGR02266 family)
MRITLKYPDVKTFVEKFASNVSEGGIFIASRSPKAVGTRVRFELYLADGATKLLRGEGLVVKVREFDPKQPNKPHGMGLKFAKLDAESKKLVQQILAFKRERGVREDSQVSVQPVPQADSGPIATAQAQASASAPAQESTPPVAPPAPATSASTSADDTSPDSPTEDTQPIPPSALPARVAVGSVDLPLPALGAPLPGADIDVEAMLAADGPALEARLERARRIARDASLGVADTELDALLEKTPVVVATAEDATSALASILGVSAPSRRGRAATQPPVPTAIPTGTSASAPKSIPLAALAASMPAAAASSASTSSTTIEDDEEAFDRPTQIETARGADAARAAGEIMRSERRTDSTIPLSMDEIILVADAPDEVYAPEPSRRDESFAAADLGAQELDAAALAEMELVGRKRPDEIEPLPPPPSRPPPMPFHLDDEQTSVERPSETLRELHATAQKEPDPKIHGVAEATAEVAAALDAALEIDIDDGATMVSPAPMPVIGEPAETAAQTIPTEPPPPVEAPKPEKRGFFKKLFTKK